MKKLIIILFIFYIISYSFSVTPNDQADIIDYSELPKKGICIVKDLRLREKPILKSEVLKLLQIGDEFQILEKSKRFYNIQNENSFWYKVKFKNYEGWLFGAFVLFNHIKNKDIIYGIKIVPIEYDNSFFRKDYNGYFINIKNILSVFSLKEKKIVQNISPVSIYDKMISIQISNDFKNIGKNTIKILSKLGAFTTGPVGYDYYRYYELNKDNTLNKLYFSYFQNISAQDEPSAELKEKKIEKNKIILKYSYDDTSCWPEINFGTIELIYIFNKDGVTLSKIISLVDIEREGKDNTYTKIGKLDLNKEELNKKFWCDYLDFIFKK